MIWKWCHDIGYAGVRLSRAGDSYDLSSTRCGTHRVNDVIYVEATVFSNVGQCIEPELKI